MKEPGGRPPFNVSRLAGREPTPALADCLTELDPSSPIDYRELAALLACEWVAAPPGVVGLAGGQGAGKSTLGRLIESACANVDLRICVLSLDDFYLPRARRESLAAEVHPLMETRGPPGTHDMLLCREVMDRLRRPGEISLPVFDKGLDDRMGTRRVEGPFDLVLLEGWCVGASPRLLDYLVYLRVPDLAAVRRWRLQQEDARPEHQRLGAEAIDLFVQHYERVTRSMMRSLPHRADLTVELADDHSIAAMAFRTD